MRENKKIHYAKGNAHQYADEIRGCSGLQAPTPAPEPPKRQGLRVEMTLEQACPADYHRAQCAFKDSMIH